MFKINIYFIISSSSSFISVKCINTHTHTHTHTRKALTTDWIERAGCQGQRHVYYTISLIFLKDTNLHAGFHLT